MISDFEIMAKAREIRDLAVEVELRRRAKQYIVTGGQMPPELAGAIESGFDDVLTVFERYTGYDPSSLEAMSESMTLASTGLDEPVADTIGSVATELAGWWGPEFNSAKQVFEREFLLKMPGILRNQQAVFGELVDALDVSVQIAASSREDLMAIADNTVTALHAAEREESSDLGHTLTVLGVVAGGLAAVFSGGSTLALALVGSAVDLTVAGMAQEAKVQGNRPRAIIDSMRVAVEQLEEATEAKEAELGKALAADLATVAGTRATHLEPIRPNIGDDLAADLDGFLPPSWK